MLPTVNEQAVRYGLQIALALDCEIAPRSIFHRKNYFYPDNPKAYQISQYDIPLATGGRLGDVRIHRVHLEEDAAKLIHVGDSGRIHGSGASLVDFNRGGTPLVEIVTEPDLRDGAQAREWLQLLRGTIKQIGASDVNMEEGSLRCDANISLRPAGSDELGTKTELKNMNSFRFIERGIAAELDRQRELLDAGEPVTQETLHFDPRSGELTSLRSKEYAHDYRYFPEPDLVPLAPTEEMLAAARESLPELPAEKRERYLSELGLPEKQATQLAFSAELAAYFEGALDAASAADARTVANWATGELTRGLREAELDDADPAASRVTPAALGSLADLAASSKVSTGAARQVLARLIAEGGDPAAIVEREGLGQMEDTGELEAIVERAIEAQPGRRRGRSRREHEGDWAARGLRHARDQGPGRRRRGEPPPAREAGLVTSCYKLTSSAILRWWPGTSSSRGAGSPVSARPASSSGCSRSRRRGSSLVNDVNFMLYTPFLPEAAAGTLEPRHVVTPLRDLLRRTHLRLGAVTAHDPAARAIELSTHEGEDETLRYDQLLVAVGSVSRSLPVPGLDRHAIGFKSLADAIWLRNHVIETLERANATDDPERREELLTYVFVGGGYSGLEAMAELQDLAADAMDRYPRARLHGMRWILVEALDRVLMEVDPGLADYAVRELRGRGIDIRLGTRLEEATDGTATLSTGEVIPTKTIVWTAGVAPHPSLRALSLPLDEQGKVEVDEYMSVSGMDGVWAAGDCAAVPDPNHGGARPCPPTAQHAVRQGPAVAHNIACELGIATTPRRFDYRAKAAFVNLGRYKAVGQLGRQRFRGFLAWWMARTYHVSQIPGIVRKVRAVVDWTVGLPFSRDVAEVGSIGHPRPLGDEVYARGGTHRPLD